MKVTVLTEEVVKPQVSVEHPRILELSAIDQVQPRIHGPPAIAFLPAIPEGMTFESVVQKSKAAFARSLVAFYPLAGRLVTREQGCLAINCNDAGILLRTAEADCQMPAEMATGMSLAGSEALYYNKTGEDITTLPLLLLQFTSFQDNSLCIYFGFHHSVTDGAGVALFTQYWNALMLGKEPAFKPVHDRFLVKASGKKVASTSHPVLGLAPLIPLPALVKLLLSNPYLKKLLPYIPRGLVMPDVPLNRLFFTKAKLKELKEKASGGLPAGCFVSTNDALTALLWQSITAVRGLDKNLEQTTRAAFAVDFRSRIQPSLVPETYFGNAGVTTVSQVAAHELVSKPLAWSASRIRDAVTRVDSDYVQDFVDWIAVQPNKSALGLHLQSQGPDVLFATLSKFPTEALNLGWGPAISFGPARSKLPLDGFVLLANSTEGVCAYVSLLSTHTKKLMQYEPLMKYVG